MHKLIRITLLTCCLAFFSIEQIAQEVPIVSYRVNNNGEVALKINSSPNRYYQLQIRHDSIGPFEINRSVHLGQEDSTTITENIMAYPLSHYRILEHSISNPSDIDNDGLDDLSEYNNIPFNAPINSAETLEMSDGILNINSFSSFETLATTKDQVDWAEYLNERAYVKFAILNFDSPTPEIYFINSNKHNLHNDFFNSTQIDPLLNKLKKGEIIYHPNSTINENITGSFTFNLSNGFGDEFEVIRRCYELLASHISILENNFAYLVTANSELEYTRDLIAYQNSRIPVLLESELFEDLDYWALNSAEGYGLFRKIENGQNPSPREIALYENLPNDISRVGGIITSNFQSPLSHINLRAIQNNIPNSFIRDPLEIDSIEKLLNKLIYYKVENRSYTIREASIKEVNDWYEKLRPKKEQSPPLDLSYKSILNLEDIDFEMSSAYGSKCTNVAVMGTFGFEEGTIPKGYGIPFYFYQEFMKHNSFFEEIEQALVDDNFKNNREVQKEFLKDLRQKIKEAPMPIWMFNELSELQNSFPEGSSIRCRSSSNNEDLPGFSGAGLYTSKTQHPSEGHISKSIKQVFASIWNLRAFEEREFYRINHFESSMAVLCHPNYSLEKANGVGVSFDPLYNSENYFYLNSQVDENLITNPNFNSIPEEVLLNKNDDNGLEFRILRYSNQTITDSLIMKQSYLIQMRELLSTIHNRFYQLYEVKNGENFAMDIEYKINQEGQLIIKQARPWVFNSKIDIQSLNHDLNIYPNPSLEWINFYCKECTIDQLQLYNNVGQLVKVFQFDHHRTKENINISFLEKGIYFIQGIISNGEKSNTVKFIKN